MQAIEIARHRKWKDTTRVAKLIILLHTIESYSLDKAWNHDKEAYDEDELRIYHGHIEGGDTDMTIVTGPDALTVYQFLNNYFSTEVVIRG